MEQHGGKSETIVGVSTSGWSSLQNDRSARLSCKTTRQREGLGEVSWNHHDSKPKEEWSHSLIKRQVRRADQALLPTLAHSFVACGRARVPHAPACKEWWWKTLCPGVDTHRSPHPALFLKTGGRRGGCVLFGHRASRAQPQQLQRWRVEMCICEWCGVVIGGLIEPSAGSRRLWNP